MTVTDRFKEAWDQIRAWAKDRWGDKISDADLERVAGQHDQFCHLIGEKCGLSERVARAEVEKALDSINFRAPGV